MIIMAKQYIKENISIQTLGNIIKGIFGKPTKSNPADARILQLQLFFF